MAGVKNILITGGNGYIAKSLYSCLYEKYAITCINRNDFNLIDRYNCESFFKNKYFDVLIHTAVVGGSRLKTEDGEIIDQNLQMYYNLLSCKNGFGKFITFGSGAELYSTNTPYGLSKAVIAESMKSKEHFYNLRVYAVFDENELDRRFIKSAIKNCIKNKNIQIHKDKLMDFFFMGDLISVIQKYIEEDNLPKTFDCVYKDKTLLSDIGKMVNTVFGGNQQLKVNEIGLGNPYTGSWVDLGIPYIGLQEGINQTAKEILRSVDF